MLQTRASSLCLPAPSPQFAPRTQQASPLTVRGLFSAATPQLAVPPSMRLRGAGALPRVLSRWRHEGRGLIPPPLGASFSGSEGAASAGPTREGRPQGPPDEPGLFERHAFVKTLEVSTDGGGPWSKLPGNEAAGVALLQSGAFHATVHPDLPPFASLDDLIHSLAPWAAPTPPGGASVPAIPSRPEGTPPASSAHASRPAEAPPGGLREEGGAGAPGVGAAAWQVRTVAAQTKMLPSVCDLMVERGRQIAASPAGGALLLVSGGHPVRELPLASEFLPTNSTEMIEAAAQLRARGALPASVELWAVENPLVHGVDRLQRKIAAGAEAVITQPPLLPDRFRQWWRAAEDRGLLAATKVVVGMPIISSSKNLSFWMRLTHASGTEADAALAAFMDGERRAAAGSGPGELADFRRRWTLGYISTIRQLPGVRGIHVMPVSARGWKDLASLVDEELL